MARKPTRNAQGSGTIRRRADGRWEARYTVGRDPGTGKQVQKSVYGKTQQEVRKKLIAATSAIDDGIYIEPSKMTFGQWLDIWLKEYTGNVKPLTTLSYTRIINSHIKPGIGKVKITALTAPMLQRFYNDLLHKKELAAKTVKNVHGVVHKALQQALKVGYIRINPADLCELPRVEKPEIKPMDEEQVGAFLKAIQGDDYERIFLVDLFTGMRQGEILGLSWDCVDFEAGSILVFQQLQKVNGQYRLAPLKNDKPRRITPAPFVMDILRQQRAEQKRWQIAAGSAWEGTGLVFTNQIGRHLAHVTVYKHFKKAAEEAGIPDTRFHDLRHTFAVASLESGDDIKTVQENLGHATASFTLDVYGHVSERMKQESAQRMQGYIERVSKL